MPDNGKSDWRSRRALREAHNSPRGRKEYNTSCEWPVDQRRDSQSSAAEGKWSLDRLLVVRFGLVKRKLYRKWFDWREERGKKTMDVNDDGDDKIRHWTCTYLWRATDALGLILCRWWWLIVGYTYFVHVCMWELTVVDRAHLGMHEICIYVMSQG